MRALRQSYRRWSRSPGIAFIAVLTLAMGIGATTAVFSLVRTVLFRPLGIENEDRLVWIQRAHARTGASEGELSWRELEDLRLGIGGFDAVVTEGSSDAEWLEAGRIRRVPVVRGTPELGRLLSLSPVLGRGFEASDLKPGADPVVLIGHDLWQTHFGGSRAVLGRSVQLDEEWRTIVGVLPPGARSPKRRSVFPLPELAPVMEECPFWIPFREPLGNDATSRSARMFSGLGRLKPGVSIRSIQAELDVLSATLAREFPESNRDWRYEVVGFREEVFGRLHRGVPMLWGAVAVVLAMCGVNLAHLMLAGGLQRRRELAIQLALGAERRRLFRDALVDASLLVVPVILLGALVALGVVGSLRRIAGGAMPFLEELTLDGPALVFGVGVALVTAFGGALLPAIWQAGRDPAGALGSGGRSSEGGDVLRWQQWLLGAQVALVMVLTTSAFLLLESFRRLVGQDLGYRPRSVITLDLETPGFAANEEVCRMYRALRNRIAAIPGVDWVGTISSAPLTGKWTFHERPDVVGRPLPEADRPEVAAAFVAFDYFQTLGIPLIEGRLFTDDELKDDGYGLRVVLNESAARILFPGRSAVGGQFTVGSNPDRVLEVIGVVRDTRDVRLEDAPQPRLYWQYAFGGAQVVVRGPGVTPAMIPALSEVVRETDARVEVRGVRTLEAIVAATVAERRFLMMVLSGYAALALWVAVAGIHGVMACQVAQRTGEFGIRLALGAGPWNVGLLVVGRLLCAAVPGVLTGVLGSLAVGKWVSSHLFGLSPHDPRLLAAAILWVLTAAILAAAFPAWRASRVDPIVVLRAE